MSYDFHFFENAIYICQVGYMWANITASRARARVRVPLLGAVRGHVTSRTGTTGT